MCTFGYYRVKLFPMVGKGLNAEPKPQVRKVGQFKDQRVLVESRKKRTFLGDLNSCLHTAWIMGHQNLKWPPIFKPFGLVHREGCVE